VRSPKQKLVTSSAVMLVSYGSLPPGTLSFNVALPVVVVPSTTLLPGSAIVRGESGSVPNDVAPVTSRTDVFGGPDGPSWTRTLTFQLRLGDVPVACELKYSVTGGERFGGGGGVFFAAAPRPATFGSVQTTSSPVPATQFDGIGADQSRSSPAVIGWNVITRFVSVFWSKFETYASTFWPPVAWTPLNVVRVTQYCLPPPIGGQGELVKGVAVLAEPPVAAVSAMTAPARTSKIPSGRKPPRRSFISPTPSFRLTAES
jgi:hypothetical protein